MRKIILLVLCASLSFAQSFAQSRVVTGKVTDENGNPLAGASVVAKASKGGTTTGADGTFRISVPTTVKSLTISSLNYVQKDVVNPDCRYSTIQVSHLHPLPSA